MGQVSVILNGRTYRLNCDDGEEQHLQDVAGHVRGHVDRLTREHGQIGDERLLLMASILITDELYELREAIERDGVTRELADRDAVLPKSEQLAPRVVAVETAGPRLPLPAPSSNKAPSVMPRLQPAQTAPIGDRPIPLSKLEIPPASSSSAPVSQPTPPAPSVRPIDLLDATALMKGLEKKVVRT